MKGKTKLIAVVLSLVLMAPVPTAVLAQIALHPESGNWLHEQYQGFKVQRSPEQVVYAYYVSGGYLEAHPERRYILRAGVIVEALAEAWPCK